MKKKFPKPAFLNKAKFAHFVLSAFLALFAFNVITANGLRNINLFDTYIGEGREFVPVADTPFSTDHEASGANRNVADLPFTCEVGVTYQVAAPNGMTNSSLYSFNVETGDRTLIAQLPYSVNGLIYNSLDNMLWGSDNTSLVRIDREGGTTVFPIANLPVPNPESARPHYNTGAELPGGYMLLYRHNVNIQPARYYVIDMNPSRSTYLQLVDPTAGFTLQTGPEYGTLLNTPEVLDIADMAFVSSAGLCFGITPGGILVSLDPYTGNVVFGAAPVDGLPTGTFGAVVSDVIGRLYAFNNPSGSYYRINIAANSATFISTSQPSSNNDGASCANSFLEGLPFTCEDGLTYQVAAPNGVTNSSLYSFNIQTGDRTLIADLPYSVNGLIYNSLDNMLWGSDNTSLVRIDREGTTTVVPIPNLPVANPEAARPHYNTGAELPNGYMLLYRHNVNIQPASYYVIDMDPSRPTYLRLVDPTAGFTLKTGPEYGTPLNSPEVLDIADLAFVSSAGLCYGITPGGVLISLDPYTGNVVFGVAPVDGLPTGTFGAVVSDVTGRLYAFNNPSGSYYRIDIATNSAKLISTTLPSSNNDGASCANVMLENLPFNCEDGITYQVAAPGGNANSSLYSFNVETGDRTLIAELPLAVNGLIYNSLDNMLWASDNTSLVRIDREGGTTVFPIQNLPVPNPQPHYNTGAELPNGYMLLYRHNANIQQTYYYVIDMDPSRSTYLQVVDPTAGFTLKTGPEYGTPVNSPEPLNIADIAFVNSAQLCYGITQGGVLVSLDPFTGNVVFETTPVDGLPTSTFGAVVTDVTGRLYAFNNQSGSYYRIDIAANSATLISTSEPSFNNDGASCATVMLCDLDLVGSANPVQSVCTGNAAAFSIAASGSGPFTYQWQVSSDNGNTWADLLAGGQSLANGSYSGAGTANLTVLPANLAWSGNLYRVNVGNENCTATSENLTLEVNEIPQAPIVSQNSVSPLCPVLTVDLTALVISNTPTGSTLAFYTSPTPSEQSLVSDPTAAVEGTYYAFYQNGACGSATTIAVNGCSLPVKLLSFTLSRGESDEVALLKWATTEEVNSELFAIERSQDAVVWKEIGALPAQGSSSSLRNYVFEDGSPLDGGNYYRLKMTDKDGTYAYSSIRFEEFKKAPGRIYPNPVSGRIRFANAGKIREVVLYNPLGVKVLSERSLSTDGLNVSHLSGGIYVVVITLADGSVSSDKAVIMK